VLGVFGGLFFLLAVIIIITIIIRIYEHVCSSIVYRVGL
jgi:hypothetical protein